MAIIKPFKAWRPLENQAADISSVPYDVISSREAKDLSKGKPNSFLHVIRPEIDLPESVDIHSELVYKKGAENLHKLLNSDSFLEEEEPLIYIYRIQSNSFSQTGVFACISVQDYEANTILKHELTRPDKEDDRTKHILTQKAHAEPVMLTFDEREDISKIIDTNILTKPVYNFFAEDDSRHTLWKVDNAKEVELAFKDIPKFYIADGHHRCASASRVAKIMEQQNTRHTGNEEYNFFPAVLFPKHEVNILPYNRIVYSLPKGFFEKLNSVFKIEKNASPNPRIKGNISFYYKGTWYGCSLPKTEKEDRNAQLDVARLQEFILEPFLNIINQRTDENLYFIGGIRGTQELERIIDAGEAELAISLFPTSINELIEVSDAGLLMPPKSTWFEPKLRSGLLIHTF